MAGRYAGGSLVRASEREGAGTAGLADTGTAWPAASIGCSRVTAIRTQRGAEKVDSDLINCFFEPGEGS